MSRLAVCASLLLVFPLAAQSPLPKAPPGFTVERVLEAPAIEAPTALCVAPNGDVYFAEDPMDMSGPPTKNLDRIWLLKGGDPTKKILFADRMWAVMGLELVGDKLYVVHAPHVTVFTLDADGKAKERKELFDDLGPPVAGVPSFNDHIPSGIHMGMDGWLYVSIGDKGIPKMTRKEKDRGSVHVAEGRWRWSKEGHHISLEGGGVIRFRPDGSGLEVFASGTRNHLDVPMDEHDRIFVRDNTDDGRGWWTRLMYLPRGGYLGYPWAYKRRPRETLPMIHDFGGGSPCGGWVYLDDGLPSTYRGRIFHCEWGQGKVWAVKVAPDGAGFKYVDQIAFLEPGEVKDFRPFSLRPTADGRGFYVTDWGFSGWSQAKKAGRIWKVTYTGKDAKPAPRNAKADTVADLLKALDHPAHSERLRVQRRLEEKMRSSTPAERLRVFVQIYDLLDKGEAPAQVRIHALWAIANGCPEKEADLIDRAVKVALRSADVPSLRQEIARVMAERRDVPWDLLSDRDAQVRLQVALAAQLDWPQPLKGGLDVIIEPPLRKALEDADPFVRHALVKALKRAESWAWTNDAANFALNDSLTAPAFETLLEAATEEYELRAVGYLQTALTTLKDSSRRQRILQTLARVYKDRKPYAGTWWGTQPAGHEPPAREVAWQGTPRVRDAILGVLADRDNGVRKAALAALVQMNDPDTLEPLVTQYGKETDADARVDIVRAVAGLSTPKNLDFLAGILADGKNAEALRRAAIAGLERSKNPQAAARVAAVATGKEPVGLRVRALEALGAMKVKEARAACASCAGSQEPALRQAAASTLAALGDPEASGLLVPLLKDNETRVRTAAIQALGTLKARSAVPALVQATEAEATRFDAIKALTQMPDRRALSAYLTGLGSKNADLRERSRQALIAVRTEVLPALKELVQKNEVAAELLPELRAVYQSCTPILSWTLIGPFPDNGTAHPPEKEFKIDAVYQGAGKEVRWQRNQKGNPALHGKVDLAQRFSPSNNVVAYGRAEIESENDRDARLLLGSDDTLTVWLNGKKVFDFNGNRGWNFDQDKVDVHLQRGKNELQVRCGNNGGPWEFSVAVSGDAARYAFLRGGKQKYDLEAFRAFARKNPGDAERGRKLFQDVKGLACIKCHAVGGMGGQVGPDLAGIGLKYKREDLMTSVLEPSKVIAQGYETIAVTTTRGQTLTGVFKGESADAVNLTDAEGKQHRVLKKNIEERAFSPVSTMPNGLNEGMSLRDFADLIAYLEARREEPRR